MTSPSRRGERRPSDGVEAPIGPVLGDGRGLRPKAGLYAVAAIALTVVAAGIGLGGGGTEPLASGSAAASATPSAATTTHPVLFPILTLAPPTRLPGTQCLAVVPGDPPEIRLGSSAGTFDPIRGVPGPPYREFGSTQTADWPVPNPRAALPLDLSASIVLIAEDDACVRSVDAEFLAASDVGGTPTPFVLGEGDADPPRTSVVLGGMPPGDWIVRVVAHFATGAAGSEDEALLERYFRVFSGTAPQGSQLIAPAVPCGPLLAAAPAPRLYLVAGDGKPVLGAGGTADPVEGADGAIVTATFPERVEVRAEGDACATSWDIRISDHANGTPMNAFAQENPGENPYLVSQNRIPLTEIMLGRSLVRASVSFGRNRTAQATWELTLDGPPPPTAEVSGPDGSRAAALPGCSFGWTLAIGGSASTSCTEIVVPEGLELLTVRSGDPVHLDLPGWRILSWYVGCGERRPLDGTFSQPTGCALGGGGDGANDAGPAIFLPFPGRHVISAWVTADLAGDQVGAQYFVEIDARP